MLPGARILFWCRGAKLPYDAEVEYLESTGTQWIDTGIQSSSAIVVQSTFVASGFYVPFAYTIRRGQQYGLIESGGKIMAALVSGYTIECSADVLSWHTVMFDMSGGFPKLYFDGVHIATSANSYDADGGNTICLFANRTSSLAPGASYIGAGKISAFSIKDATTTEKLIDLIPVRKDGVGYMYDRVSSALFGNSGTGAFVIGPDKTANSDGGGYKCVEYSPLSFSRFSRLWKEAA